jgi:transcriptional regulator with XRE-family HTH domain
MPSLATIVAANISALRQRRNLTQKRLADASGVSVSYISMLERGNRTPPLQTLEKLAGPLKVEPWMLLRAATANSPPRS